MGQYLSLQIRFQSAVLWLIQKHSWKCNASDLYSGGGLSKITRSPAVWTGIFLSLLTAGRESTWVKPRSFPSKSFITAKSQPFAAVMLRYFFFWVVMQCSLVYYWRHSESVPSSYQIWQRRHLDDRIDSYTETSILYKITLCDNQAQGQFIDSSLFFYVHVTVHHNKLLCNKTKYMH
jgi:hypothetical protein